MYDRSETDLARTVPRLLEETFSPGDLQLAVPVIIVLGLTEGTIRYEALSEEQKLLLGLFVQGTGLGGKALTDELLAKAIETYVAAFPRLSLLLSKLFELARDAATGASPSSSRGKLEHLLGKPVANLLIADAEAPEGSARGQLVRAVQIEKSSDAKKASRRKNPLVFGKGE